MAAAWEGAKRALATGLCVRVPARRVVDGDDATRTPRESADDESSPDIPPHVPVSSRRLSRSRSRSSTKTCSICLGCMRSGHGQALFTAECSHKFHFHCISSNVQHGSHVCPICRAVWKELPFLQLHGNLPANAAHGTARINPLEWPRGRRLSTADGANHRQDQEQLPASRAPESGIFGDDDDELMILQPGTVNPGRDDDDDEDAMAADPVEIVTYAEFPAVQQSVTRERFDVLIRLKAPRSPAAAASATVSPPRPAIDLVAVLDASGSMAGTKLQLLKRAMGLVIRSLGANDRLCIIAFKSSAWRLFPLRKMTAFGRQQSLRAVGFLAAGDGSNMAEALAKASRVMEDRQARNPACGIILLSDGQVDDGAVVPRRGDGKTPEYGAFVPCSIRPGSGHHVRIDAFGFGADHDAAAMRAIAEVSGGTFSFIDAAGSIQGAFARCIGGLLGVVARETRLSVECAERGVLLTAVESGGYASRVDGDRQRGFVDVGDLYAGEERDFLVTVHVPAAPGEETALLVPSCTYRAALTMETVRVEGDPVIVARPAHPVSSSATSREIERERHRVHAVEDMATARAAAEHGDFARAASILEGRRRELELRAALSADARTLALVAELREMQDRVETRRRYEESGRAYVLAGLSSHSWQRAMARGDSTTEPAGLAHTYQTPCMLDMLHRSQMLLPEAVEELSRSPTVAPPSILASPSPSPSSRWSLRPTKSFPGRPS